MYRRHRNFISVDIMCLTNHVNPPCFHVALYGWVEVWYTGFQPTLMSSLASLRTLKIKSVLGIWKRKMSSRAVYDPLAVGRSMSFILIIKKKKKASGHLKFLPFLIDNSDSKSFSNLQMGTLLGDRTTTYIVLSAWYQSLFSVPPFIPGTQKITQQSFWNMFQLCNMVII